jgi:putative transposase
MDDTNSTEQIWIEPNDTLSELCHYAKHPEKYFGKPGIPGYKEKNGEFTLIFTNQQVSIEDGQVLFPENLEIANVKTRLEEE